MDVRRRAVLGLGLAGGLAVAAARAAEPPRRDMDLQGDAGGRFAGALTDIDAYAGRHMEVYGLPGLTLAVVGPDGLTAFLRYGHADLECREPVGPDHLFQIGSISKSFTALCIAPAAPYSPPTPPQLLALTGHYECDDPWAGSFWVTAQGPALFVDDITPLTPLPDGGFRVGDKTWSPERMRFEAMIDGRPQRAIASGVDHVRRAI